MNGAQRLLSVVAVGLTVFVAAGAVNAWLSGNSVDDGWFNYAPNNGFAFSPSSSGAVLRELLISVTAILIWFGVSYRLLRNPENR